MRGSLRQTRARTAVVLALGAFGTPELLIRSGIGHPADLGRLGLPVRAALPGVGANLQDHPPLMGVNFRARSRLGLARDNGGGGAIMNWRSSRAPRPDLHAFVVQGRHAYPGPPPGTGSARTPACSRSRPRCSARAASDG
jgi:choline dehydrogenase